MVTEDLILAAETQVAVAAAATGVEMEMLAGMEVTPDVVVIADAARAAAAVVATSYP